MGAGSTKKVTIEVEAKAGNAIAAMDKLASATSRAKEAAEKTTDAFNTTANATSKAANNAARAAQVSADASTEAHRRVARFDLALEANTATFGKNSAAMGKGSVAAQAFGSAIRQVETGQASLKQGIMTVAAAFGPLGIAIGVAGSALVGYVQSQHEAAKATEETTRAAKKQARELAAKKQKEATEAREEKYHQEQDKLYWGARQREVDSRADELKAIENALAQHGRGADNVALLKEEARIREANASSMGDHVGAAQIVRDLELELLNIKGEQLNKEKAITKEKENQIDRGRRSVDPTLLANIDRNMADQRSQMNLSSARRNATDVIDPFSKENERQEALDILAKRDAERKSREQEAKRAAAEADKKRHDEELARLKELEQRHERTGKAIGDSVGAVAAAWLYAGDLSAKGFAKALAGWGKAESIKLGAIAISEGVQALVSAAFFNFPQAALHGAAAAQAAAGAVVVAGMTGALGGFGSISKNVGKGLANGGAAFGPGAETSANNRPDVSNSQTDTTPLSPGETVQHAHNGGPTRRSAGGPVTIHVFGSIDDDVARKIDMAITRSKKSATG